MRSMTGVSKVDQNLGEPKRPAESVVAAENGGRPYEAERWSQDFDEPEINLNEYIHLLWAKRWLILLTTVVVVVTAVAWAFTREEVFSASTTISIDVRTPEIMRRQLIFGPSSWEQERYLLEQERILISFDLATRVAERVGILNPPEDPEEMPSEGVLLGMLRVESEAGVGILNLSMKGSNPEQITEWLNIYVDEYIRYGIEDTLRRTQQVYEVIQSRLQPLHDQLKQSENTLTSFKERRDSLLAGDQDKNVISEQVNMLTTDFAEARAERIRLETKIHTLKLLRADGLQIDSSSDLLNDSTLQTLRTKLFEDQVKLQEALTVYREGHPDVKDLRGRILGLEARIENQINTILGALVSDYETTKRREQILDENLQQLREETIELGRQSMEYETLKRDYEQNKSFYEDMLARSKEAEISGTVSYNRIRVIDKARVPKNPISPNIPRSTMVSLALGLFLGIGLVLFIDYLDQSMRTPADVERHIGLDVFSVVPVSDKVKERAMLEVYQGLRTALMFAARDKTCQLVMLTSSGPSEGKTTTTMNLGKVLSSGGSKVLIIEADLRRPALRRMLHEESRTGLSTLVLGETTLQKSIRTFDGYPNLDILTSGPPPSNPPEIFGKKSFQALIEETRSLYDWVLIDTPPVISVTDAVICSNSVDMVLFVIEYGRLDRKVIQGAHRQLQRAGARIVGAVLNRVNFERSHYYYEANYYSYYYGFDEDGENLGALAGNSKV